MPPVECLLCVKAPCLPLEVVLQQNVAGAKQPCCLSLNLRDHFSTY